MAIVAVCRLANLKRMPATPLTLLVAHRVREQVKVQRSGKMKIWDGSRTQRAIKRFSDKNHLAQIKIRKEKKKEETERERMERLNRDYNDIDWVGLYNSDKLSSLRVDELSLYFSHHKITFKGKKTEKIAMIKAHIGSLLYNSMGCQQPRQSPLRNVHQQATSSLSEVETDSQSDIVDRVVGSSPSSSSDESSPETDFLPKPGAETLPTSKYGRKRARVERDNYVSWDKIVF